MSSTPAPASKQGLNGNSRADGSLTRLMGVRAFVLAVAVAVLGVCASPAWGAFPGRDGDLVVATGSGLELVAPGTGAASPICTDVVLCGHPAQPSVSANGRAVTFVDTVSHRPVVIAADGSCVWCLLGARLPGVAGSEPAFTASGRALTVARRGLWRVSLTGGGARRLVTGPVDSAVWSSRGLVALVRGGWIWVGRPGAGKLRRLARGRSPSFSPDGARVALAYHGHVWIVRVADGSERRLVRGGAPAWSPNGLRIAYIASGGAVEIVAVHGGRSRRVGSVSGTALDWQPLPSSRAHACKPPARATVLASNREAVLFSQGGHPVYGCLKALGVTRRLPEAGTDFRALIAVRLAGRFAALEPEYSNQYADWAYATLYDLSSGKATHLDEVVFYGTGTRDGLDFLALDSSGFAAWRDTSRPIPSQLSAMSCPSASLCVAGDDAGNILTSSDPLGGPDAWSIAVADQGQGIVGISCPSVSMCVAADSAGNIVVSTDPTGGQSAWSKTNIAQDGGPQSVSCASVTLCVAVGNGGKADSRATILTSSDPGGGASAWSSARVGSGADDVVSVSCPSVSLCVAVTDAGEVVTSTDPTGGASAWKETPIDRGNTPFGAPTPYAVSCPSVRLCVVVDWPGRVLATTDPTGGANAWSKATIEPGATLNAVSCPSVSLCIAGDNTGNILTSADPTGGERAWAIAPADQGGRPTPGLRAISCPSVSLCVAGDTNGEILTSTDPTGGANAWSGATVDVPGCPQPSTPCTSERLYAHDDQGTRVVDTAPPGQGNSIDNVALNGNSLVLSWTRDGAPRQRRLR
jgi:WD40 repeat protein